MAVVATIARQTIYLQDRFRPKSETRVGQKLKAQVTKRH